MTRDSFADLSAFLAVAREGSFTRAAAGLGLSPSALSHTIRSLETRLGLRLLARTTRSVAPTEAGARLLASIGPRFDDIAADLAALSTLRDRPSGSLRLTCSDHSAEALLLPRLGPYLAALPEVQIEISIDYGLTDIVAERFDAGVRLGEQVDKDMVAVRIGPPMRMAVVGAPAYLVNRQLPAHPRDLIGHSCINLRQQSLGGFYAWEFSNGGHDLRVRVSGQFACNRSPQIVSAALLGLGLAYVPADMVNTHVAEGRLVRMLRDWCATFSGYHLYYPSRRQPTPAFAALVEALRWREAEGYASSSASQ